MKGHYLSVAFSLVLSNREGPSSKRLLGAWNVECMNEGRLWVENILGCNYKTCLALRAYKKEDVKYIIVPFVLLIVWSYVEIILFGDVVG